MFHAGDEFGRTQGGNNNAYCQDNEISWVDWSLAEKNKNLLRFFKKLIAFRKNQKSLQRLQFSVKEINGQPEMSWHGTEIDKPDWSKESKTLGLFLAGQNNQENDIYIMINGDLKSHTFELPIAPKGKKWRLFLNTFNTAPDDIIDENPTEAVKPQKSFLVADRSVAIFITIKEND